jgi:hypothetical protein
MKLLWLGLGAAAAYVLLKKDETSASSTVLVPTPVPGLAPTRTCAEWDQYSKSCADLAAMGASCEAWVGSVPQGCPAPGPAAQAFPVLIAPGLSTPIAAPLRPPGPTPEQIAAMIAGAERARLAANCCPQGMICSADRLQCKSDFLLSAW